MPTNSDKEKTRDEPSNTKEGSNNVEREEEEVGYSEEDLEWFLSKIMASPITFCKVVFGVEPFPYQEDFFADRSPRIAVCSGRQVGKTLIAAMKAIWFALLNSNTVTLIVSKTRRQSMHMFAMILRYVEGSDAIKACVKRKTRTEVNLTNGSQIIALPCGPNGDTIRSKTAHLLIVDEANFVPEVVITEVAMPMLATTNGTLILLSSPGDKSHYFYRAFTSESWSRYHFKTSDNPLVTKEYLDEMREIGELSYRREFEGEFVDQQNTYFPATLLDSVIHKCGGGCQYCRVLRGEELPSEGELFAGYDPGGLSDYAALVVVQRLISQDGKVVFKVVLSKTFRISKEEKKLEKQNGTLDDVYTRYTFQVRDYHQRMRFRKLLVDSTSLGNPILSHLKELKLPAEGVTMSVKINEEILSNVRILLEQKKIELPDDPELKAHLNCITFKQDRTGKYLFDHPKGTHDDLAYALALAVWAAKSRGVVIESFVHSPSSSDDESDPHRRWK